MLSYVFERETAYSCAAAETPMVTKDLPMSNLMVGVVGRAAKGTVLAENDSA